MGYYSDFLITTEPEDSITKDDLVKLSGYSGWHIFKGALLLSEAKWYDVKDHVTQLSQDFPDVKITVKIEGEDKGDLWTIYALNGQVETATAKVSTPPSTLW